MKRKLILLLLVALIAVPFVAGRGSASQQSSQDEDRDLPERDEINQTYELSPGARVQVSGINGAVDIETATGSTAEVHVIRSARTKEDLEFHKVIIEHTANNLVVRGEKDRERPQGGRGREVRQRVMLKIPRRVELNSSGINGRVTVGEVDGSVQLSGINGKVKVAQAVGYSHISGINGTVAITIARLGERGIHVSGVNGGVELRFTDEVSADLEVSGTNGKVNADLPNITIMGKVSRENFRARIGAGGTTISVSGVNGHVRLSRAGAGG
jgi:hypothetical protein